MQKLLKYLCSFGVVLGLLLGFPGQVLAQGDQAQLTVVHLESRDVDRPNPQLDLAPSAGKPVEGITYRLYQLKLGREAQPISYWEKLTLQALEEQAQTVFEAKTDAQGRAVFLQLPVGMYYGVAVENQQRYKGVAGFLVNLTGDTGYVKTVYPKVIWPTGGLHLIKYGVDGQTKVPLAGVRFELYEDNGFKPLRVKDGLHSYDLDAKTTLITNQEGQLKVAGLLAGNYYLKEVATAKGYRLKTDAIPFQVQAHQTKTVSVDNQKEPPPPVTPWDWIPKTGEEQALALIVLGLILMLIAFVLLYHQEHRQEDKD
ncbi:TPA: SpaA isopeptide-forming pilin-related protein [Streptococcus pyogenes]|uniref:SpaA isopeptide-forming pilin-related protein n=1 Tax=Streptococcus pyogenes TaxID=1314 RepID=UPI0010132AD2|nr:SpaA isopeptide-forming pilin-related protein [Streptococcus pyogenes]HER4557016.1 LPXTG cell wall anchor domain-containing protein [Streptococcus pyogenes NGAS717]HER4692200.1 LPXTG cell wall anchor domain-containing protein [Streptococcus pyogenes NGAS372]QAX73770.1 LPXTG cell wall anchor domain-containing protein [Streptococcus pyogenes]UQB40512.1 LPXTG cell wall anchor domain-containing protein [Streptococcus pyogenes]VGR40095.1 T-antigen-like fimbrial structural subunit protein FszE [S